MSEVVELTGTAGTLDNDIILTIGNFSDYMSITVGCIAGTVDFEGTVDGTNWFPVAGHDVGATAGTTDVLSIATGNAVVIDMIPLKQLRINQSGVTASNANVIALTYE